MSPMYLSIWQLLIVIIALASVGAVEVPPRSATDCEYLSNKIYCYGVVVDGNSSPNDALIALDISSVKDATSYQSLNSLWESISVSFNLGKRITPQVAALPDGKQLLIYGGYNSDASAKLANQTLVYNTEANTWISLPNFNDAANGGDRQIYNGTAVFVPNLNGIGFYGGYEEHVQIGSDYTLSSGAKLSNLTFTNTDGIANSYVGFYYFTLFDLSLNAWTTPQQYNAPLNQHTALTATYHPDSKKIIYMGGGFYDSTSSTLYTADLNHSMIFDTTNGQWSKQNFTGPNMPKYRTMHTATLLTDGNTILMYGGTANGVNATVDYCYTLDVPTMAWTRQSLIAPLGTASGPRFQHSAVLVNHSVFILFGFDKDAKPTSDLLVLDVRNVSAIAFSSKYPLDSATSATDGSTNTNGSSSNPGTNPDTNGVADQGNSSRSFSKGAIIGTAVGGSILVIFLVTLCIVLARRSKKDDQQAIANQGTSDGGSPSNHNDVTATEEYMMEVDWDKIEKLDPPHQLVGNSNDVIKPSVDSDMVLKSPDVILPMEKPDGGQSPK